MSHRDSAFPPADQSSALPAGCCWLCVGKLLVRPFCGKTQGGFKLSCLVCSLTGFVYAPRLDLQGVETLRRLQRMLLDPEGHEAYAQILASYAQPFDLAVEECLPHRDHVVRLRAAPPAKKGKPKALAVQPEGSNDLGYCPLCADLAVLRPYLSHLDGGFTMYCQACNLRAFTASTSRNALGLEHLRRQQRMLQDPRARAAYVEALELYQDPRDPEVEAVLPSYDLVRRLRELRAAS